MTTKVLENQRIETNDVLRGGRRRHQVEGRLCWKDFEYKLVRYYQLQDWIKQRNVDASNLYTVNRE